MDEELSQVAISTFGYPHKSRSSTGANLSRNEAQPRRPVTSLGKRLSAPNRSYEGAGRHRADTGDHHEPLHHRVGFGKRGDLLIKRANPDIEFWAILVMSDLVLSLSSAYSSPSGRDSARWKEWRPCAMRMPRSIRNALA